MAIAERLAVGQALPSLTFGPVTTKQMVQWAAAANDFHEIHYDKDYAKAQGLPDVVVHGPLKLALMGRQLLAWAGPQGWIRSLRCRYLALDVPGTVLRCEAVITALQPAEEAVDLELSVVNEKDVVTARGTATVQWTRPWQQG